MYNTPTEYRIHKSSICTSINNLVVKTSTEPNKIVIMFCVVFLILNRYYKAYKYKTLFTCLTVSQTKLPEPYYSIVFLMFRYYFGKKTPVRNRVFVRDGTQYTQHYDCLWCLAQR